MVNTDRSAIKRSKASESTDKTKSPKQRKKQKKSKSKNTSKESENDSTPTSSLETTATPEGVMMTQVLSTFSRLEQSRFEAFRRATFPGDAISRYVAYCLAVCHEQKFARSERVEDFSKLEDMVAPGQSDEIVVVVSALAKAYAQRLVSAARRVATCEGYEDDKPLLPSHLENACLSRKSAGLDPGFFMSGGGKRTNIVSSSTICTRQQAAALGITDPYELLRNAALAAQDEYDEYQKKKAEGKIQGEDGAAQEEEEEEIPPKQEKMYQEEEKRQETKQAPQQEPPPPPPPPPPRDEPARQNAAQPPRDTSPKMPTGMEMVVINEVNDDGGIEEDEDDDDDEEDFDDLLPADLEEAPAEKETKPTPMETEPIPAVESPKQPEPIESPKKALTMEEALLDDLDDSDDD